MSIEQFYAANIRKETSFFATWAPNDTIAIGDFGAVNGAVFQRFGHLDDREIARLDTDAAGALADYDIMIGANRSFNADVKARADAGVADSKALLQVNFTSERGILFSAVGATSQQARDLTALGRVLKDRSDRNLWNMDHAVVVQVATVGRATVLLSNESGASLNLEVDANAPLNAQVMANLDAGTSVLSVRGVGMRIVGSGPMTPLFRLAYLRKRIFRDPEIAYRGPDDDAMLDSDAPLTGQRIDEIEVDADTVLAVY